MNLNNGLVTDVTNKEEENKKKTIDIFPIKKYRRILVFLGDMFITYILCLFVFNLIVFPIYKAITGYNEISSSASKYEKERMDILYNNKILFYDEGDEDSITQKYLYSYNLTTTAISLMSYYVVDSSIENEVVYNYYTSIATNKKTIGEIVDLYKVYDSNTNFFDFEKKDSNGLPLLKEKYITEFSPAFNKKDEMGTQGKEDYNKFITIFFLNAYYGVMDDISTNDIMYDNLSYKELTKLINEAVSYSNTMVVISTYISFAISWMLMFLVYPLVIGKGKTLSSHIMRIEKVNSRTLNKLKPIEMCIQSSYYFVTTLVVILFVPFPNVDFNYLFNLNSLYIVSGIALLYIVISFIFLLFNKFNRTLSDYLSDCVMIDVDSLDEIYRAKGYEI